MSGKLDVEQAAAMLAGGMTVKEVATRFRVTPDAVYKARQFGRLVGEAEAVSVPVPSPAPPAGSYDELRESMERLVAAAERVDLLLA